MNQPAELATGKVVDSIQQRLTDYAYGLNYDDLTPDAIHTAKLRVIDTLGALIGGFFTEPCRIARNLAAGLSIPNGATVIGTQLKTTPDMAAFVNGTTARYAEMNDIYHQPGSFHGHPSDVITPVIAVAEHAKSNGPDLITGIVLAYEIFLRFSDIFQNHGYDHTNFCCVGTAAAAGKLLGLSPVELSHCISMAVVPNNILKQVRQGRLSMWKAVASGYAGRAGIFAALLARAGMQGPHLPFEGKAGWCDHIARKRFSFDIMGGNGSPFKILDTRTKSRPSCGETISSILAAEKVAPIRNIHEVKRVTVEVYKRANKEVTRASDKQWQRHPDSRETADQSLPYVVAATLIDGTVTLRSFNESSLWNRERRALMEKIEIVTNDEFTKAFERSPIQHRTRVTVVTENGERFVGESGGDDDDPMSQKSDAQIIDKFRSVTEDYLGSKRVNSILDRLWHIDEIPNIAEILPALTLV